VGRSEGRIARPARFPTSAAGPRLYFRLCERGEGGHSSRSRGLPAIVREPPTRESRSWSRRRRGWFEQRAARQGEALLAALREYPGGDNGLAHAVCNAVEDIGVSRMVLLTVECKLHLLRVLEEWSHAAGD